MTKAANVAQDLINQILTTGEELKHMAKSGELTRKAKTLASQGEDILVDKLGLEDNDASREALRKGVGAGAAAGALALLLSHRSGRKIAAIGGLAGLGMLAYQAYEKNGGQMPDWKKQVAGALGGGAAQARTDVLLKAMVAAAKVDGEISTDEMALVQAYDGTTAELLGEVMLQTPNPREIAAMADNEQTGREIYAVSARVANGLNDKERAYLDRLAMALDIDPEVAALIENDIRTG